MEITLAKDGNISREQVWVAAWLAVATASNSTRSSSATDWADICLKEFDKRFAQTKPD